MTGPSPDPAPTGRVLEIQRMSTEDGPGIRTTVFFKGCSLRCGWCHNPESIALEPEMVWRDVACIGCRSCVEACPRGARTLDGQGAHVDRERCTLCGTCAHECPGAAIEMLGADRELEGLVAEVLKDRAFYEESGGGVTASGGEPALQSAFVAAFLRRLQAEGVHTALDTCGACGPGALQALSDRADLVLFDLKCLDDRRHEELTGQGTTRILANLRMLADRRAGRPLWIRTPLIPGATACADDLAAIGAWIADELGDAVSRWELCAFNNLCQDKYRRLGRPWPYADTKQLLADELAALLQVAQTSGIDPGIVVATGPVRRSA